MHKGKSTTFAGLGRDMPDHESVRATTEPAIGYQRHTFTQTRTDKGRRGFQHLGHTRCAFRSDIPYNHDVAGLDLFVVDTRNEFMFPIEYACRSFKTFAFFSAYLGYTT